MTLFHHAYNLPLMETPAHLDIMHEGILTRSPAEALTRDQVRQIDRRAFEEYGVPGIILMENAGRGVAELSLRLGINGPVAICCGKGNNGGDGFVIARHLDNEGVAVRVYLATKREEIKGDAALNLQILERSGIAINSDLEVFNGVDWVIDALLGTGLVGAVKEPFMCVIDTINRRQGKVLAVDIPSGLDCDSGLPLGGAVRATHTATLVAMKSGFANDAAVPFVGNCHVVGIGVPRRLLADYLPGSA
jgi:NAD(P)H-hydrate epimerase